MADPDRLLQKIVDGSEELTNYLPVRAQYYMNTTAFVQGGKRKLWDHNPAGAGTFLSMGREDIELNPLDQQNFQLNQDSSKETSKVDLVMPQTFTIKQLSEKFLRRNFEPGAAGWEA